MKDKSTENCLFPVFQVPKLSELLQKHTHIDETRT